MSKLIKVERESLKQLFETDPDIGFVVVSNTPTLHYSGFYQTVQ